MKVRELIRRLERENPDAEVLIKPFLGKMSGVDEVMAEQLADLRLQGSRKPDRISGEIGEMPSFFRSYPAVILIGG